MSGHGVPAQPGVVPAATRSAGTMFAALYGRLVPHTWRDPESEHDAYQLFHQRSLAMGWLDDGAAGGGPEDGSLRATGLWGMNDAGWNHPLAAAGAGLVSWFQVEACAVAGDRPLPVQPFLRCAGDATARAGSLDLSAVQVLLPVQGLDPSVRPPHAPVPSMPAVGWFAGCDPRSRTPVDVIVDSGRDPSIPAVATRLREHMGQPGQVVFGCRSRSLDSPAPIEPPFGDTFWNGPPRHRAAFHGELAEWSLDALGWLAGFLADVSAGSGVDTPLLLTVVRARAQN